MTSQTSKRTMMLVVASAAISCGGGQVAKTSGAPPGEFSVTTNAAGQQVFNWRPCDALRAKDCGDSLKVVGLMVHSVYCREGIEHDYHGNVREVGKGITLWHIGPASSFGASLKPPITYGVVPAGATELSPAISFSCPGLEVMLDYIDAAGKRQHWQQTFHP